MTRRIDYEYWTIESLDRLVGANERLKLATNAEQRREALRLIELAHTEAVDAVEQRDNDRARSVRAFPSGFHGLR